MCGTRIHGASEKSAVKSGIGRATNIAGVWPQTHVFRFKTIFGDRAQTRRIDNQFKELILKSAILNRTLAGHGNADVAAPVDGKTANTVTINLK